MARERGLVRRDVMLAVLEQLRKRGDGLSKEQLTTRIGNTTSVTVQRALKALREEHSAPITYDRGRQVWQLHEPSFALPLEAPRDEDVMAVLLASAVLAPMLGDELATALGRLAENLDERRREGKSPSLAGGRLTAALTLGCPIEVDKLKRVVRALRKGVLRMTYLKPWTNQRLELTIEPWAIRLHDGSAYLRAWCQERRAPRTYRFAQIQYIDLVPSARPTQVPPEPDRAWGDADPAYGIDDDRPATATIRVRGGVARWLHPVQWHPEQVDTWPGPDLLERRVPYRSCREMARRLLMVVDGIVAIEPPELRDQVEAFMGAYAGAIAQPLGPRRPPQRATTLEDAPREAKRRRENG